MAKAEDFNLIPGACAQKDFHSRIIIASPEVGPSRCLFHQQRAGEDEARLFPPLFGFRHDLVRLKVIAVAKHQQGGSGLLELLLNPVGIPRRPSPSQYISQHLCEIVSAVKL
jgi:hypothetical protein